MEDQRVYVVRQLINEHLRSPSLKHMRDAHAVEKLSRDIIKTLDRRSGLWQKWEGQREVLLKAAAHCWVPVEALREYLNHLPGPPLTTTDVAQRLRAYHEESHESYPDEELQAGCLIIYEGEKAAGTELPAIVGALQEHVEQEQDRLRLERQAQWRQRVEEQRIALEQSLLSGADCKWTPLGKSKELYCRVNGRTYRLSSTADKMWHLHRLTSLEDRNGRLIGKYRHRGDATKVLRQVAYQPEPKR